MLSTIWDRILDAYFTDDPLLAFEYEFKMSSVNPDYIVKQFSIDRVVGVHVRDGFFPLLHIEAARTPIDSLGVAHKDEQKIALLMAESLLAAIGMLRSATGPEIESLRSYGLLVAGDELEVVVMRPVIYDSTLEEFRFDFMFESNRESWRFKLFREPDELESPSSPPALSNSICPGNTETLVGLRERDPVPVYNIPSNIDAHKAASEAAFNRRRQALIPNIDCFRVIQRVKELLIVQADKMKDTQLSDSFSYPHDLVQKMSSGRDSHFSRTPRKNEIPSEIIENSTVSSDCQDVSFSPLRDSVSDSSSSDERDGSDLDGPYIRISGEQGYHNSDSDETYQKWPSDDDMGNDDEEEKGPPSRRRKLNDPLALAAAFKTYQITKKRLGPELKLYHLPEIIASNCFPKLVSFTMASDKSAATLVLEKVKPFRKQISRDIMDRLKAQLLAAQAFVDCCRGLKVIHAVGYVHGDISPNNIGWNERLNCWQIFDFNHARRIEKAAKEVRSGGTRTFRSPAYQKTGLFFPVDDYFSLFLTCTCGLYRGYIKTVHVASFEPLKKLLLDAMQNRVDADLDTIIQEATRILETLKADSPKPSPINFSDKENRQI